MKPRLAAALAALIVASIALPGCAAIKDAGTIYMLDKQSRRK